MGREELIDYIARVLGLHDCASEYATYCICNQKLYTADDGGISMRRHRAEKIVEALEIMEVNVT